MRIGKAILSLIVSVLLMNAPALSATTAIKAGHLINPKDGTVTDNQIVIVKDGRIEKVGPGISTASVDQIVDLSNSWVMPGLIDTHVHITANFDYKDGSLSKMYTQQSTAYRALLGAHNAKLFLYSGFTTIKDIGNDANYATADVIKAINNGWTIGPTIYYSGKIIAPYGGQSNTFSAEAGPLWNVEYIDADSKDAIRKAIRQNVYYGANTIKLVSSPEISSYYDEDEIRAAVDEAAKKGMKVTVHTLGGQAATNVINGGAAAIEHGIFLTNEHLELMKQKGTFLVGTDFWKSNWESYGLNEALTANLSNAVLDRLKRADKIGVNMAYGTDIVIDMPGKNRVETSLEVLKTWKAAGVAPMKTLKCMTVNAAELLGTGNERGQIATTYRADIIALGENPLDDIENIKTVHFVMKDGKIVRQEILLRLAATQLKVKALETVGFVMKGGEVVKD